LNVVQNGATNRIPSAMFVCPAPLGSHQTVLQVNAFPLPSSSQNDLSAYPVQIGFPSHGRVCYDGTFFMGDSSKYGGAGLIAIGGEDGKVKVFTTQEESNIRFVQEVSLPSNVSAKVIASAGTASHGIVVAAGGKLMYSVWKYKQASDADEDIPLDCELSFACSGSIWPRATQDHRVLSLSVLHLEQSDGCYHIVMTDSRGVVSVCLFSPQTLATTNALSVIETFIPFNECPLLASSVVLVQGGHVIGAFGDTTGSVSIWMLLTTSSSSATSSIKIAEYSAHSMGTNALSMHVLAQAQASTMILSFLVCSGGDDQALCIANGDFSLEDMSWSRPLSILKREGAAGAAMKSVRLIGHIQEKEEAMQQQVYMLASLGCDQRLCFWSITMPVSSSSSSLALEWRSGGIVNIGDVQSLCISQDKSQALVVGQGLQLFSLSSLY